MNIPGRVVLIGVLAFFYALTTANAAQPYSTTVASWPHEGSEFSPDPKIKFGRLSNGLRYIIYPRSNPGVHILLEVAVGSVQEHDDQNGFAHLTEHIVFNNELKRFESLDVKAFPSFTNTHDIGYDATSFSIDVATNQPTDALQALSLLRALVSDTEFGVTAFDDARRSLQAEQNSEPPGYLTYEQKLIERAYSNTVLATRNPMGSRDVIQAASPDKVKAFYSEWYRPDLTTIIVVGGVEAQPLEDLIKKTFADWTSLAATVPSVSCCDVSVGSEETFVYADEGVGDAFHIYWFRPYTGGERTMAMRRGEYLKAIIIDTLRDRIAVATALPSSTLAQIGILRDDDRLRGDTTVLNVLPKPGKAREAFVESLTLINAFKKSGVTDAEVQAWVARHDSDLAEDTDIYNVISGDEVARELLRNLHNGYSNESRAAVVQEWNQIKTSLSAKDTNGAIPIIFGGQGPLLVRTGPNPSDVVEKELVDLYDSAD